MNDESYREVLLKEQEQYGDIYRVPTIDEYSRSAAKM